MHPRSAARGAWGVRRVNSRASEGDVLGCSRGETTVSGVRKPRPPVSCGNTDKLCRVTFFLICTVLQVAIRFLPSLRFLF